jgi:hypothetical protein
MHAGRIPTAPELCEAIAMTARDSDRDVWHPPSRGLIESSIYPVEHGAGASEVGSPDSRARRTSPHLVSRLDLALDTLPSQRDAHELGAPRAGHVVVRGHAILHERVGDAPHALSREPSRPLSAWRYRRAVAA